MNRQQVFQLHGAGQSSPLALDFTFGFQILASYWDINGVPARPSVVHSSLTQGDHSLADLKSQLLSLLFTPVYPTDSKRGAPLSSRQPSQLRSHQMGCDYLLKHPLGQWEITTSWWKLQLRHPLSILFSHLQELQKSSTFRIFQEERRASLCSGVCTPLTTEEMFKVS